MFATYEEAFAYWAPHYRAFYRDASEDRCIAASEDCIDTLAIWTQHPQATPETNRSPYVAKLQAELDACRDRLNVFRARRIAQLVPIVRGVVRRAERDLGPLPASTYLDLCADQIPNTPLLLLREALRAAKLCA